jgi:hypothetical protein
VRLGEHDRTLASKIVPKRYHARTDRQLFEFWKGESQRESTQIDGTVFERESVEICSKDSRMIRSLRALRELRDSAKRGGPTFMSVEDADSDVDDPEFPYKAARKRLAAEPPPGPAPPRSKFHESDRREFEPSPRDDDS